MNLSIESLKLEFKQYLIDQGITPELDKEDQLLGASIFAHELEFKDFIEEKYDIDINEMSIKYDDLMDMEIEDGQFVIPEDQEDIKDGEITQDDLMLTILNALLEDEDFVENLDETQDGKLDKEEIMNFLAYSNDKDEEVNKFSFTLIISFTFLSFDYIFLIILFPYFLKLH